MIDTNRTRAWIEVDTGAIARNAATLAAAAEPAGLLPMVKANAYGVGVEHAIRALEPLEPWGYGVATLPEAQELVSLGVRRPIVVFTPVLLDQVAAYNSPQIRPVIDDARVLRVFRGAYHLNIDTGMGRAGVRWDRLGAWETLLVEHPPEGVGTHFYAADAEPATIGQQLLRFDAAVAELPSRPAVVHVANSAAILRPDVPKYDLVRPGIFLYGGLVHPDLPRPEPVIHLRARVCSVRALAAGDTVSYEATWTAPGPCRVATLAIGYGDGVPRVISSHRASVAIRGRRHPVIGRITMDLLMVDVSADDAVQSGDVATLIGQDGGAEIPLEEFAATATTSVYESLVTLGYRLPRLAR